MPADGENESAKPSDKEGFARIFLSYARGDDEPFVKRLHGDLTKAGFDVWFDRGFMPSRSLTFHQEIRDAIASRERLILVVGPKAINSDYVTQEWQFAYYAANKCVNPIVRLDGRDSQGNKVDGYALIPEDLKLLHAEDFRRDAEYAEHLKNLIRQLSETLPPVGKLVAVPELPPGYRAQPERLKALRDLLLLDLQKPVVVTGAAARVGLQGMGGIGKSVLANAMAHDQEVQRAFQDGIYWVTLGQQPRLEELQRQLAVALGGDGQFNNRHEGKEQLRQLLADRAVLLILDDVWERDHADAFNVISARSRILLTTRDAGLVTALAVHENHYRVELPTIAEAQAILAGAADVPPDQLPPAADAIIKEYDRLPLALALCGGMVHGGSSWANVLAALQEHDLEFLSNDHPDEAQHQNAWKAMDISLRVLSADEQQRFAELAVFGADTGAPDAAVATLWEHTAGLGPRQAEELLAKFIRRSLVQRPSAADGNIVARVDLHDLLHHFATGMAIKQFGSLKVLHQRLLDAYRTKCPKGWPSGPNDGYFLQNIRHHFIEAGCGDELVALLLDLMWLKVKNEHGLTFDLPMDFTAAIRATRADHPQHKLLPLIEEALRRDIHFIARRAKDYPQALFQCLWNSCWWYDCPEAAQHYAVPEGGWKDTPPWERSEPGLNLFKLLEIWRTELEATLPGFNWLRSLRPPEMHLGTGQKSILRGHDGWVTCVTPSPDGSRIASASEDGSIRIWNATTGEGMLSLQGHTAGDTEGSEGWVNSVAFSRDGRYLVSGGDDHTVRIWDARIGSELRCLRDHRDYVNSVSFSPDGTRIVSGSGGYGTENVILIWDAQTGARLRRLGGHTGFVHRVTFSPDGSSILSASVDHTIRLWNARSGKQILRIPGNHGAAVAFSPDGSYIVGGGHDRIVHIWEVQGGKQVHCLVGHEDTISDVACSPNGRFIVSSGSDKTIRIWDAITGRQLRCLRGHEENVASSCFSPDGLQILSGSWDHTVRVWNGVGGDVTRDLIDHSHNILCKDFSPDGRYLATGSVDKSIRIWDVQTGSQVCLIDGNADTVQAIAYSRSGRHVVSGSTDRTLRIWDVASGIEIRHVAMAASVYAAAFSPDDRRIVVGTMAKVFRVIDAENGKTLCRFKGHATLYVNDVCFSPDGSHIASASSDETVRIWEASTGNELRCLRGHGDKVREASYSPDGKRLVSLGNDDRLWVWDAQTGACIDGIDGIGNVENFSCGEHELPVRALTRNRETRIEHAGTCEPAAWFPRLLPNVAARRFGQIWAASDGSHLYLYQLEGNTTK